MKVLVLAPHPDDETLGCGGTLLHHQSRGDELHWLLLTAGIDPIAQSEVIQRVSAHYRFSALHWLKLRLRSSIRFQ